MLSILIFLTPFIISNNEKLIQYQPHSYNDKRLWSGLIKKMQFINDPWFKFDINYVSSELSTKINCKQDKRGCFVLSHDNPIENIYYSLPSDLINFILENNYFKEKTSHIALCFKYSKGDICNGTEIIAKDWYSLTTDLINELTEKFKNLPIEIIIDGSATPGSKNQISKSRECLVNSFNKWNSTFIPHQDPASAIINNDNNGNNRLQIPNIYSVPVDPVLFLDLLRGLDWGKFKENNYPSLIWEPSNQMEILMLCDSYLDGPFLKQGLKYAINIDPFQFEIYSAKCNKNAWNVQLKTGTNPLIVQIDKETLFLFSINDVTEVDIIKAIPFEKINSKSLGTIPGTNWTSASKINDNILLGTNEGKISLYNQQLKLIKKTQLIPSTLSSIYSFDNYILQVSYENLYMIVTAFDLQFNIKHQIKLDVPLLYGDVQSINIAGFIQDSLNIEFVIILSTYQNWLYSLTGTFYQYSTINHIGVGNNPHIIHDGLDYILVHDYGYCWNTELRNKNSKILSCDQFPEPTNHILNYAIGPSETFLNPLTPCNENYIYGSIGLGDNPNISPLGNSLVIIHEGFDDGVDVSACGLPMFYKGIVLEGFKRPFWFTSSSSSSTSSFK